MIFFIWNYICQTTNTINYNFLFLFSSWWIIYKARNYYMYVVSSVFVLVISGFDTLHAQGKIGIVCRTFAILTLPCYLILNNKMLDLTRKGMFQRGVNHGCHSFWCTSYLLLWCCPNRAVLCKVGLQELTPFYKQLGLGTSPQICLYIQDFYGLKLLNQACNEWRAIALARAHTRQ